jgi:succinylarginine dihydrolase
MAEKASNGKELLLVMRAAVGVFPAGTAQAQSAESKVRSIVTAKMMELATLDQLIEYAMQYPVNPESARPFVERMFQLGGEKSDSRVWYRIRVAASRLKVGDLERQAQTRGDRLAGR